MPRRIQVGQATLDLGRTFWADGKRRGGSLSANEDRRETSRSPGRTFCPDVRRAVGRTVREGAGRASFARFDTGEGIAFPDSDADSASKSKATGDPGWRRDVRDSDS